MRLRSFRIRSALGTWKKICIYKLGLRSSRLYRPISCQLTYKGTNCLSNLKDAAMWREKSARARAFGVQNERGNKIERERTRIWEKKSGERETEREEKGREGDGEMSETKEPRTGGLHTRARHDVPCVHACWILIFTQPRHDIKGPVACHALLFPRLAYRVLISWKFNSQQARDAKRTHDSHASAPWRVIARLDQSAYSERGRLRIDYQALSMNAPTRSREIDTLSLFPSRGGSESSRSQGRLILIRLQKIDFPNANEKTSVRSLAVYAMKVKGAWRLRLIMQGTCSWSVEKKIREYAKK